MIADCWGAGAIWAGGAVETPPAPAKPRLYRHAGTWFCSGRNELGYGDTPAAAFQHWVQETLSRYDFA